MTMKNKDTLTEVYHDPLTPKRLKELNGANSHCVSSSGSVDLRVRDQDGYVTNENRCDSCDGDGYHVTEIGTDYICDHCNGSGLI